MEDEDGSKGGNETNHNRYDPQGEIELCFTLEVAHHENRCHPTSSGLHPGYMEDACVCSLVVRERGKGLGWVPDLRWE